MKTIFACFIALIGAIAIVGCEPRSEAPSESPTVDREPLANSEVDALSACELDQAREIGLSESEIALGLEATAVLVEITGKCPAQDQLHELRYIWSQNSDYWSQFPASRDHFVRANFIENSDSPLLDLVDHPFDDVHAELTSDPDFPIDLDSGPVIVNDISFYEFSGGQSVYLVVVRNGIVSRIYDFDQI